MEENEDWKEQSVFGFQNVLGVRVKVEYSVSVETRNENGKSRY